MIETIRESYRLSSGAEMPVLGVGTWKAEQGGEVESAVRSALELGYRSIDTASAYGNEEGIGAAMRDSGVARGSIFLATKVWNDHQGYDKTLKAFDASLDRLQTKYVDLYLVHWPVKGKIRETWRAMEEIYHRGHARAIGVCNFLPEHLAELLNHAEVIPMVNQIEFHPYLQQREVVDFCQARDILVEAWSPLMRGEVFEISELREIGERYGKSAGQVTLRWQLQRGLVTIPKSVKPEHLESNSQIFEFSLDDQEMRTIDALDRGHRTGPDPATFGFS